MNRSHPRVGARGPSALLACFLLQTPLGAQCLEPGPDLLAPAGLRYFGSALALDGDRLAVGAAGTPFSSNTQGPVPGAVLTYLRDASGGWVLEQHLTTLTGAADYFGTAVALDGDTLAVMAPFAADPSVQVFRRVSGTWQLEQKLGFDRELLADDIQGSLALVCDTLVVGAPGHYGGLSAEGTVYVHERDQGGPGVWGRVAQLTPPTVPFSYFGAAVALSSDGDTLVAGQPGYLLQASLVRVFERDAGGPGAWGEVASLQGSAGSLLGTSVAIEGHVLVAGAAGTGFAKVYERDAGGTWNEAAKLKTPFGTATGFGCAVAIVGERVAVVRSTSGSAGAVHLFDFDRSASGGWYEIGSRPATQTGFNPLFDTPLAFDGEQALVGHPHGDELVESSVVTEAEHQAYCAAGTTAQGCVPYLTACGVPSATAASGFELWGLGIPCCAPALFFHGVSGRQALPWGSGGSLQCVVPPVRRATPASYVHTSGPCGSSAVLDLNASWCPGCPKANQNPGPGTVVQAQLVQLETSSSGASRYVTTNAIEFVLLP